ncbi:MAG: O-antigen ligase family protein [Nitrospirota bacterium]
MKLTKTLVLVNLFFLQSYLVRFSIGGYPTNLQEILIGITAIIFIVEIIKNGKLLQTIKNIWKHKIILAFIGLTVISLGLIFSGIITVSPPLTENLDLIRHLKFLFFATTLGFIFLETFQTKKKRSAAIMIAGLGAIIFGIFSIIYNLSGYNVAHDLRLLGPLDAAVYLAFYLTPFFLYFSTKFIDSPRKKSYLFYAIILAFLILATRSMGAIGGSFLVILIYLVKTGKFLKNRTSKISLLIISVIIFGGIFYTKILPAFQTNYSSLNERGEIWTTAADLLKEPKNAIFGVGFGQFQNQYFENVATVLDGQPLDFYVLQPHNIFLLFILNYGILGLLFLGFLIFQTIKKIAKSEKPGFALFIILYFLIHGLIDTPFFKNDLLILLIIFLEMGLEIPAKVSSYSTPKPNPLKRR